MAKKTNGSRFVEATSGESNGGFNYRQYMDRAIQYEALASIIANATSRSTLARRISAATDPRRNINDECGYPETANLTPQDYRNMYDREPIATRVVEVLPKESWKVQPTVFEDEDADRITAFEQSWADLPKTLRGESWYQDDEGNPIWEHLQRLDVLSGIGSFGVLLYGFDDGMDLAEPIRSGGQSNLLYLRTFDESLVKVLQFDNDVSSPRYGHPLVYSISFCDLDHEPAEGIGRDTTTHNVHWTRVLHSADNLVSSEVFGTSRLQSVWNRLYDLQKIYGGSAEMYWRGFGNIFFQTDPALGGEVTTDAGSLKDEVENMFNGLQRWMLLNGLTANSVAPDVKDPTPFIDAAITAICIKLGIPKRIFIGSERGELSSGQDERAWNARLINRQQMYITPRLIIPFLDRLIWAGALPEPEGYSIVWPSLGDMTPDEQATVALKKTDAIVKYVSGSGESLLEPLDYLTRILDFTQEEAEAILEARQEAMEEEAAVGMGTEVIEEESPSVPIRQPQLPAVANRLQAKAFETEISVSRIDGGGYKLTRIERAGNGN